MDSVGRIAFALLIGVFAGVLALPNTTHAADDETYVVVPGDTLIGIARKAGVRLSALMQTNDLELTSLIVPGQELDLPSAGGTSTPSTSPATSGGTAAGPSGSTHVVKWGDTLSGIAARHGVSLRSLLDANGMTLTSLIVPGRELAIPGGVTTNGSSVTSTPAEPVAGPAPAPAATSGSTHVVRAGDTLIGIAGRYGISLSTLLATNDLTVTSLIVPGQQLLLPSNAAAPVATPAPSAPASTPSGVATVVDYALAQVGKPYRFFTKGPDTFDCSGLTLAAYRQIGIDLVHYSGAQARQGRGIDFHNEPIRPGDLVFQARNGSERINHVGMAVTATTWIQAVGSGVPVKVGPMPSPETIVAVRRFVES